MRAIFATVVFTGAALAAGCSNKAIDPPAQAAAAPADAGKIPITTSSGGARQEFFEGRSLAGRLRLTGSIAHCDKAIALDPSFGLAELARANASPTGTEFSRTWRRPSPPPIAHRRREAADRGRQRGRQRQGPEQPPARAAVAAQAQDERAHFALGAQLFGQQDPAGAISTPRHANAIARTTRRRKSRWECASAAGDFANAGRRSTSTSSYPGTIRTRRQLRRAAAEATAASAVNRVRKALSIDEHFLNSNMASRRT